MPKVGAGTKIYRDLVNNALQNPERCFDEMCLRLTLFADFALLALQNHRKVSIDPDGTTKLKDKLMKARAHIHQAVNIIEDYRGKPVGEAWRSEVPQFTAVMDGDTAGLSKN